MDEMNQCFDCFLYFKILIIHLSGFGSEDGIVGSILEWIEIRSFCVLHGLYYFVDEMGFFD